MSQVLSAVLHRKIAGLIEGEPKAWSASGTIHLRGDSHSLYIGPAENVLWLQALWERKVDEFLSDPKKSAEVEAWKS